MHSWLQRYEFWIKSKQLYINSVFCFFWVGFNYSYIVIISTFIIRFILYYGRWRTEQVSWWCASLQIWDIIIPSLCFVISLPKFLLFYSLSPICSWFQLVSWLLNRSSMLFLLLEILTLFWGEVQTGKRRSQFYLD